MLTLCAGIPPTAQFPLANPLIQRGYCFSRSSCHHLDNKSTQSCWNHVADHKRPADASKCINAFGKQSDTNPTWGQWGQSAGVCQTRELQRPQQSHMQQTVAARLQGKNKEHSF
jgi:hypothetical protein